MSIVAVVGCAAGGLETLLDGLVRPLVSAGHTVPVVLTPAAARWLQDLELDTQIQQVTGLPVRSASRLPREISPHPAPDIIVGAPMTANSVAKLALGIADNQALTLLCENLTVRPTVVFPRVNAAHARHPAWRHHLDTLVAAGVELIYGDDVWQLFEPRQSPSGRRLPWSAIVQKVHALTGHDTA